MTDSVAGVGWGAGSGEAVTYGPVSAGNSMYSMAVGAQPGNGSGEKIPCYHCAALCDVGQDWCNSCGDEVNPSLNTV